MHKSASNTKDGLLLKAFSIVCALVAIILLLWPAFVNGYPLVYTDTGTYIFAGFEGFVPVDRPISYCLFVRYTSLAYSLWFVLLVQAVFVFFTLYMCVRIIFSKNPLLITAVISIILTSVTGIANYTSQIMPDIFSALTIVGIAILFSSKKIGYREILLLLIVLISSISHISNLAVVAGLTLTGIVFAGIRYLNRNSIYKMIIIGSLPFLTLLLINFYYLGDAKLSRSRNVFIFSRMIDTGLVPDFLRDYCKDDDCFLCSEIDRIPTHSWQFLWNQESPLYDSACMVNNWDYCWESKEDEFGELIQGILSLPSYRNQLALIYSKDFFRQILDFDIGPLSSLRQGSPANDWISIRYGREYEDYTKAKQFEKDQNFIQMSQIQRAFIIISLLSLVVLIFLKRRYQWRKQEIQLFLFLIIGVLGNALTVNLFSTVLNRYQARVIWIVPLIALLMWGSYLKDRAKRKADKSQTENSVNSGSGSS